MRHLSEEHKKKVGDFHRGRKRSKETIERLRKAHTGRYHSEETKRKLSRIFKGKPLAESTKLKMSLAKIGKERPNFKGMLKGEKNPAWNGGTSFLPYPPDWKKELKEEVKIRDGGKCRSPYCGRTSKVLNIHHIDYDKGNCSRSNLITLCSPCNVRANGNRKFWKKLYKSIVRGSLEKKGGEKVNPLSKPQKRLKERS